MAYETYTLLYHEIFTKVNNAKDTAKKVAVLKKYYSHKGVEPNKLTAAMNA